MTSVEREVAKEKLIRTLSEMSGKERFDIAHGMKRFYDSTGSMPVSMRKTMQEHHWDYDEWRAIITASTTIRNRNKRRTMQRVRRTKGASARERKNAYQREYMREYRRRKRVEQETQ